MQAEQVAYHAHGALMHACSNVSIEDQVSIFLTYVAHGCTHNTYLGCCACTQ